MPSDPSSPGRFPQPSPSGTNPGQQARALRDVLAGAAALLAGGRSDAALIVPAAHSASPASSKRLGAVLATLVLAGALAIGAAPTAAATAFRDVPANAYYADAVAWGQRAGITTGTSKTQFEPQRPVTRAELVTFLWRASGQPSAQSAQVADVPTGTWYTKAVDWAVQQKVTTLVGGTRRFEPHRTATRAEAVTFLWRVMGSPSARRTPFRDVAGVAWAIPAISWAHANGVTTGVGGTLTFDPNRAVSRADALVFVWRAAGSPDPMSVSQSVVRNLLKPVLPTPKPKAPATTTTTTAPPATTTTTAPPKSSTTTTTAPKPPTTTTTAPTTSTTAPSPTLPGGWRLHWADEFDGTSLRSHWRAYHNTYGEGNNELACLTPNNLTVSGGTLKIQAKRQTVTCPNGSTREFTSGFIGSREAGTYFPRYGRFEIRARLPHAQGLWPAFWLRHRNGAGQAEVDVMEYFHSQVPGKTTGTLHLDGRSNLSKRTVDFEAPTATPGWHVWAVEIEPVAGGVQFTFFLDGSAYHSYVDTQRQWASLVDPNGTWDLAVNLAVGGKWTGHPDDPLGYLRDLDRCAQKGTPPSCTTTGIRRAAFPETYEVDYVRVYTR